MHLYGLLQVVQGLFNTVATTGGSQFGAERNELVAFFFHDRGQYNDPLGLGISGLVKSRRHYTPS